MLYVQDKSRQMHQAGPGIQDKLPDLPPGGKEGGLCGRIKQDWPGQRGGVAGKPEEAGRLQPTGGALQGGAWRHLGLQDGGSQVHLIPTPETNHRGLTNQEAG